MKEEDLIRAWNHVRLSEEKKSQLKDTLRLKDSAEGTTYKKIHEPYDLENGRRLEMFKTKKRIVVLAAAVIMALGITAFAATGIISNWYSSSSSIPDYRTLPSAEQVKKDIGYDVILIESFSNGYSFKNGRIVNNKLTDEDNQTIEKFKSVAFCYKKGRDEVEFTQDQYQSDSEKTGEIAETVNGVDIYYYRYVNKIVPPDYQLTEEDKKAEENGELVFSYGSDKVQIITWQHVDWSIGDNQYELFQEVNDRSLAKEEIIAMAKDVIRK